MFKHRGEEFDQGDSICFINDIKGTLKIENFHTIRITIHILSHYQTKLKIYSKKKL